MQYGKYVLFQMGNTYLPFVTCDKPGVIALIYSK